MSRGTAGWLAVVAVFLAACAAQAAAMSPTEASANIQVYFSDPESPIAQFSLGGPDEALQAAIDAARLTIDVAIYDLNLYGIRDALVAAEQRGVEVRMVVESENFTPEELLAFTSAGIPVIGDDDPDAMHDKFVIIDRYEVWTGSMNYTLSDVYRNRNNLIRLRSTEIAENYEAEFDEMFSQGLFGAHSPANTPNRKITINGSIVETYFSPEDRVEARLVELVNSAEDSVYFLAYSLTSDALAEAMIAAQVRGVKILGVIDKAQAANAGGEFERLTANGIEIRLDGEEGRMHHKVLIIDGEIVVTGSYNFSANAEKRNDENLLVIHNAELASKYMEEFWSIWDLGLP
ncbi:MAG TPA: phospholipase D-like domain-containing protein [Anaerolineales bacterium]|nr:phospholipase D-like domain-containing protein [Anaerolineales bacterium]